MSNPFDELDARLEAATVEVEREIGSLGERTTEWMAETAWLGRQKPTLSSWIAALNTRSIPSRYHEVETQPARLAWWRRAIQLLHWRFVSLRCQCAFLSGRVHVRSARRRARAIMATDEFFLLVLALLVLIPFLVLFLAG